jgi:hypothetical protein
MNMTIISFVLITELKSDIFKSGENRQTDQTKGFHERLI